MNIKLRITTWAKMFFHITGELRRGNIHVEQRNTKGPVIFGVHIGIVFISRHCCTCGYLETWH